MAVRKGSEGKIKVGSATVAEVKSYSLEESSDTVEKTAMGDSSRSFVSTLTSFVASVDVNFDETDSGQTALSVGSTVTLEVYPEGDASGDTYYQGSAIVTGFTRNAAFDGLVEASVSLQGTGGLTTLTA
mgnify:FL=1|tara:strand:+ start:93 stop:479 length:387 start_codon:yes stop_codon:yes gene_type:complete